MASEDVVVGKRSENAVNTIVNLAEEAKMASEGVKAPSHAAIFSICKSLAAGGIAGGVHEARKIGMSLIVQRDRQHVFTDDVFRIPRPNECYTESRQRILLISGRFDPQELADFFGEHLMTRARIYSIFTVRWSRTAVAPLERLKILLQVQNSHNIKYNGTVQGLKYIWRTEGLRGMFKGNGTNCARIVPNSAVKFFSYEEASRGILWFYRQQTGNVDAELTPLLRLGAGACAGIIAMSATYPMDLVRGRITVQTDTSSSQYRGIFHALRTVFVEEGPRALYKGWLPSVIGVIPYVGLNFAVYESLKDWLVKTRPLGLAQDTELSVVTKLGCGAVAGTIGQTVAYPLDVIRRRMQMGGWKNAASVVIGEGKSKAPIEYSGMIDAFRKTVRHDGVGALYKGLVPNSVKVVPSIAIAFVTYEVVKDILGVEMRISD